MFGFQIESLLFTFSASSVDSAQSLGPLFGPSRLSLSNACAQTSLLPQLPIRVSCLRIGPCAAVLSKTSMASSKNSVKKKGESEQAKSPMQYLRNKERVEHLLESGGLYC